MESGAIMLYLADKYGRFMPSQPERRWKATEWLMWQMGGLGPMLGQTHHFAHFNPGKAEYAEERYRAEAKRLYWVLEKRLEGRDYIVDDYSIVDMACWPWVSRHEWQDISLEDYPNIRKWYQRIAGRPAVQAGYNVPKKVGDIPTG
jgi:GST-like protein